MKIQVTRRHILKGVKVSASGCPVAFAIKEALGASTVAVSGTVGIDIYLRNTFPPYNIPESKTPRGWISKFDTGEEIEPFEFDLDVPDKFKKQTDEGHKRKSGEHSSLLTHPCGPSPTEKWSTPRPQLV